MGTPALDRSRAPLHGPSPAPPNVRARSRDRAWRFTRRPTGAPAQPTPPPPTPRPQGVLGQVLRRLGVAPASVEFNPTPSARLALKTGISDATRWGSQPGAPAHPALQQRLAGQDAALATQVEQHSRLQQEFQDVRDLVRLGQAQAMRYLQLQERLQRGTFSALSNLLKARFDALRRITQGFRD